MTSRDFQGRLQRRARRAGLNLDSGLAARLERYYRLLTAWNERINLSGLDLVAEAPATLDRILVEPLVAARHVRSGVRRMVDIGSGGGSPAIPMALGLPGVRLLMVESKTRKAVFLREALRELELTRGDVATSRFEELLSRPELHEAHDLLTLRAVRVDSRTLMSLQALVKPGGALFLFRSTQAGSGAPPSLTLPLALRETHPLVESLGGRLAIVEKARAVEQLSPGAVSRETGHQGGRSSPVSRETGLDRRPKLKDS